VINNLKLDPDGGVVGLSPGEFRRCHERLDRLDRALGKRSDFAISIKLSTDR
jgi:hypothetical protein